MSEFLSERKERDPGPGMDRRIDGGIDGGANDGRSSEAIEIPDSSQSSTGSEEFPLEKSGMDVDQECHQEGDYEMGYSQEVGMVRSLQETARKFYSTTSSVYAEHTISNPNAAQILFCISTVLQAQIFDDISASAESRARHPEFNQTPVLPLEVAGDVDVLPPEAFSRESENDEELRTQLIAGLVPTVETIYRYLNLLKEHARYPTECNIVALIYINRMTSMGSMPLTMENWRSIWVTSIILAQKMWDDTPLKTSAFAHILPSFGKQLLRNLELKALSLLQFSSGVKPSLYAQYYFELRTLFAEINVASSTVSCEWTMKPLSIIKARRLEDRSANVWDKKTKSNGKAVSPFRSPLEGRNKPSIHLERDYGSVPSGPSDGASQRKGWQTSSPSQASAHARLQMIGMHEESKGKNFNPYVFDARSRTSLKAPAVGEGARGDTTQSVPSSPPTAPEALASRTSVIADALGYDYSSGWVYSHAPRNEEQVIRTFEDVTLTDTSRFVLS